MRTNRTFEEYEARVREKLRRIDTAILLMRAAIDTYPTDIVGKRRGGGRVNDMRWYVERLEIDKIFVEGQLKLAKKEHDFRKEFGRRTMMRILNSELPF